MGELRRKTRLKSFSGVLIAGVVCAAAFCYFRPFDVYLLNSWESELSTIADQDVEVRLEQIAGLGERSWPTLVAALHHDRQLVASTAAAVLRRELAQLELRSTDESSRIVARLAHELAARSDRPGPHSAPASTQLATRLLLWPIDRASIDGERLVADCESIIRSASRSPIAEQAVDGFDAGDGLAARGNELRAAEILSPVAGGGLPVRLMDAPPLPPQIATVVPQSPTTAVIEPPQFISVQTPRAIEPRPRIPREDSTEQPPSQPPAIDSQKSFEPRPDTALVPRQVMVRPDVRAMEDLDLMRTLADADQSLAREAGNELYQRGFKTKHLRLAALLVDPDPSIRLALVRSLPQMAGIDSRPWLLWLSRDPAPAVRKAAVAVIATSSDAALLQRVRQLEREETDDEVLRVVRQVLNTQQATTIR